MDPFLSYLLKSAGVLALFLGCYQVFLKRETFFTANRFFLLSGLVLSIGVPFLTIVRTVWIAPIPFQNGIETTGLIPATMMDNSFNWQQLTLMVYLLGITFMTIRLFVQAFSLVKMLHNGHSSIKNDIKIVKTTADISPCSFFNNIVYNPDKIEKIELQSILDHEKCHVRQLHSVDILLANFLVIFQWFNPLVWLYRFSIRQNLEYLADAEALRKKHDKKEYQYLLLKSHVGDHLFSLVNPFFNSSISSIKKRIVMLNKEKSSRTNMSKIGIVLPLLVVFILLFNVKTEAKIKNTAQTEITTNDTAAYTITKETTDTELNALKMEIANQNATLTISELERNKSGRISKIELQYNVDNNSHITGNYDDANGINAIHFGISKEGGIYIKSSAKPTSDLKKDELISSSKEKESQENTTSTKANPDGKAQNLQSSVVVVHDSVNGQATTIGKASGVVIDVQDKEPLVLINGKEMPHTALNSLNPDQIKSMHVWKGTEAVQKYGKKAKDGAIEIQTKDSKYNPVTYDKSKSGDFPGGINIRSSVYTSPSTPLYFIDGKEATKEVFDKLDPTTIESINVLKGEKAIKKHGQKGRDGVIEIKTKKSN